MDPRRPLDSESGFTLLEVIVAIAILVIAFASIYSIQFSSLRSFEKTRDRNLVSMLARGAMAQTEVEMRGKAFNELQAEQGGQFDKPYETYRWTRKIKEIEFPTLPLLNSGSEEEGGSENSSASKNPMLDNVSKMISQTLTRSIREVTVTISWKRGKADQSYQLSTYWVDFSQGVQLGF